MIDREKVISGLAHCIISDRECVCPDDCPYCEDDESKDMCETLVKKDALFLLKEQRGKRAKQEVFHDTIHHRSLIYDICGNCGFTLYPKLNYCPYCGREVL